MVVFPYLHHFRYGFSLKSSNYGFSELFSTPHFDSFQNTICVIKLNIITYGEQLLGGLLFFIPHSLWEGKTGTSSFLLCDKINYDGFCNIAISYFGEGYINFGFLGLFIFLIILIIINECLDQLFLKSKNNLFKSFFLCLVFYEFYLLRGSLDSSIEKLAILLFAFLVYITLNYCLTTFNTKKN
ncbi:O-antigen polysaccharide polymerase Wzy [Aestuariivivens marinum]|uniref:O-antigen polysaccharide polymerase Wzy n=1 Tax=Aestuariivivens marinum TaxID=2913555 RepID=UPI00374D5047